MRAAAPIFDPNLWEHPTKGFIYSCCGEYQALVYCVERIREICKYAEEHCEDSIESLRSQWRLKPGKWASAPIYSQCVDLHVHVEAFFGGMKSLLDLLSMLLHAQGVIGNVLPGFNSVNDDPGRRVLNALGCPIKGREDTAARVSALITTHKRLWIDEVVGLRHSLTHPTANVELLMFKLNMAPKGNDLECRSIAIPCVGRIVITAYTDDMLRKSEDFAREYLSLIRTQ